MIFAMPKTARQIKRLQEKGYPVKNILDIIQYAKKRAKQLNFNFEIYERLQNLVDDEKAKKKSLKDKLFN